MSDSSSLDAKLQFRFGGPVELFVNSRIVTVETHVGGSTVRVTFKDDFGLSRNSKELA